MRIPARCFWLTALLGLTLLGWLPMLFPLDKVGAICDWDMFLAFYEAIRKSIVEYGQVPFWNPWHFGGTPLLANPQLCVFGLETPLIVLFGTIAGLKLAILGYALLGAAGMWCFLRPYAADPAVRAWGALVFALSGCMTQHIGAGHPVMLSFFLFPWLLWALRETEKGPRGGIWLGVTSAMILNHAIHYMALVMFSFAGIFLIAALIRNRRNRRFYTGLAAAALTALALGGYRTVVTLDLLFDFPRKMSATVHLSVWDYLLALVYPFQAPLSMPHPVSYWLWSELGCYAGAVALGMFLLSLKRERRWWHWGFLIASVLALDSDCRFLPGYWVRQIPPFTSFFAITRWRFAAIFCLALGAARGMEYVRCRWGRKPALALVALSTAGLLTAQLYLWHTVPWTTGTALRNTVGRRPAVGVEAVCREDWKRFGAVSKNYDLLFAYESLLGYETDYFTKRLPSTHPYYEGEFTVRPRGAIRAVRWSPNRVELAMNRPGHVLVNQNPSSYWRNAQNRLYTPDARSFQTEKQFILPPSPATPVVLQARPRRHEAGLLISGGAALTLLVWFLADRRRKRRRSNIEIVVRG